MHSTGAHFEVQYEGEYLQHVEDWDMEQCSAHAKFSSDENSLDVAMPGARGVAVVLGRVRVDSDAGDVHRWSFRVSAEDGWEIGLVSEGFDAKTATSLSDSKFACAITPTDIFEHGSVSEMENPLTVQFAAGDIIDLELDALRGTVRIYHNGKKREVAFDLDESQEYHAAVSLAESHAIELLRELQRQRPFFDLVGSKIRAINDDCTVQNNKDNALKSPTHSHFHTMRRLGFAGNTEPLAHKLRRLSSDDDGAVLDRAFKVGEKVRVIQLATSARNNTARAPGWSWLHEQAARCGHSGVVDSDAKDKIFPDVEAGYFVKFPDGDRQP